MLDAIIRINSIDYENTLQHIFPVVSKKLLEVPSKRMVVKLFRELGDAALPVLIGLSYRLPEDTKNELLIRGLNAYAPVLKEKLNEELQKDSWGRCFTVGSIAVKQQDGIILDIDQIDVKYHKLLDNEQVNDAIKKRLGLFTALAKGAAGATTMIAKNTIEQRGLDLLQRDGYRERMLELVKNALEKYGIKIDLEDIQIVQVPKITEDVVAETEPFTLTEKMEDDIIAALAGYLRDNMANGIMKA